MTESSTRIRNNFPYAVRAVENLTLPLADGTKLAAKLWLPEGAGAVPAILEYLPYRKREGTRIRDEIMHRYLAGHGYACIRLDIRGTGDSEGLIDDEYTEQEQADGCEAIAWLAAQEWCDGQIAMIGISWGGFNGLQIAARRPPALKTIITVGSTDDRYATDVHYIGGCLSKDNFDWSATMLAHNDLPPDPELVGKKWRDMWQARMQHNKPWSHIWLRHQRRDAYWKQGSVCEKFSAINVPVYAVSGWADNYSESVARLLAGLGGPRLGLVGPWAHSYPHNVAVEPAIGWLQEVLRWCDHWLKKRDTGIMKEPMYRVWMQESVPPKTCYLDRPGRWVAEPALPSPNIKPTIFHLNVDRRLSPGVGPSEALSICSPLWVGLASGEIGRYGGDAEWPPDQREDDGGSLVFASEPLSERLEILGAPKLSLSFSCDKPQALVAVRLNDVFPDGASTRVTLGLLNLTHRDSHEYPEPLIPGKHYQATVELDDIAHSFPAGHRIAVALSTTYWPVAWPSPELATLSLRCGESWLELPIRPPRPEDKKLRAFDPPEAAPPPPVTFKNIESSHPRRVIRDLLSGKMTVDFPRWPSSKTFDDLGITQTFDGYTRFEIVDGDPLSATVITENRVTLARPDATVGHNSKGRMTCDATHFILRTELAVTENGKEIFHRTFDERIPRDMI